MAEHNSRTSGRAEGGDKPPVKARWVFLCAGAGTLAVYAVFYLRQTDVVFDYCGQFGFVGTIMACLALVAVAAVAGLIALDAHPQRLRGAVTIGMSLPSIWLAIDIGGAAVAPGSETTLPASTLSDAAVPDERRDPLQPPSMADASVPARASGGPILGGLRMVFAPVSTVTRYHREAADEAVRVERARSEDLRERIDLVARQKLELESELKEYRSMPRPQEIDELIRQRLKPVDELSERVRQLLEARQPLLDGGDDARYQRLQERLRRMASVEKGATALVDALGRPAVGQLVELLDDSDRDVRVFAAGSLGRLGSRATGAEPELEARMKREQDAEVKQAIRAALAAIRK